jgi:hypothetical protein
LSVGLAEDDFRGVSNRSCDGGFSEEVIGELEIDIFVILITHFGLIQPLSSKKTALIEQETALIERKTSPYPAPIERLDKGQVRLLFFSVPFRDI